MADARLASDRIRIIERLDAPDFNVGDVQELKMMFIEDTKWFAQHAFWGAIYGKLLEYTELYCIQKNMK